MIRNGPPQALGLLFGRLGSLGLLFGGLGAQNHFENFFRLRYDSAYSLAQGGTVLPHCLTRPLLKEPPKERQRPRQDRCAALFPASQREIRDPLSGATKIKNTVEAPGHRPNKGPRAQIGRIKKNRGRPLALPCLAYLASNRPRSPCLHLATTARPPSAAGRRGAPLLLLLVQARRARPMRGEVSQASQGLVHTTHVLLGLSHLETFSETCTLKKRQFWYFLAESATRM